MRFDSKQFFLDIIIVFEVTHLWHPQKMDDKWPSHFYYPQKLAIDLLFKIMESANTWQILRTPPLPTSLLFRHDKCMFLFWFFKVWSVTCLNANGILDFMKIQSSYLLSSYQRNQKMRNIQKEPQFLFSNFCFSQFWLHTYAFFYKQFIFEPRPEYCLSFFKKITPKNCFEDGLLISFV